MALFAAVCILIGFGLLVFSLEDVSPKFPVVPVQKFFVASAAFSAVGWNLLAYESEASWFIMLVALLTGYMLRGVVYLYKR